jgi:plastocyanin
MKKIALSSILIGALLSPLFAAEHVVDQLGRKFIPATLKVKVGDTIRLKNSDPFAHNAYTDDRANEFDTGMQAHGEDAIIKIKAKSTFEVFCAIHPEMVLKVTAE